LRHICRRHRPAAPDCTGCMFSTGGMQHSSFHLPVPIVNVCAQTAQAAQFLCRLMDSNSDVALCPYFMFGVGFVLTSTCQGLSMNDLLCGAEGAQESSECRLGVVVMQECWVGRVPTA
jgi:hypothetical protein